LLCFGVIACYLDGLINWLLACHFCVGVAVYVAVSVNAPGSFDFALHCLALHCFTLFDCFID